MKNYSARLNLNCAVLLVFALQICFALSSHATITENNYWRMGENDPSDDPGVASSTTDPIGGHTLTLSGSPVYAAVSGSTAAADTGSSSCINFISGSYGVASLIPSLTNNFGIELWVNPQTITGNNQCLAYNGGPGANGWGLYIEGSDYVGLLGDVTYINGSTTVTTNTWTHLALVRNNGTNTLYVNGIAVATSTATPNPATGNFGVAASPANSTTDPFKGYLDEVRVFTFAVNAFSTNDLLLNTGPPASVTSAAGSIANTGATLNGTVNPDGLDTAYYHFQYGTTTNYGSNTATNSLAASKTTSNVNAAIVSLSAGTLYHFRLVATNGVGTVYGADSNFTTLNVPSATTEAATAVGATNAMFNGSVNPNGAATTYYFKYGPTTGYGSYSTTNSLPATNLLYSVTNTVTNLSPDTLYHFELVAVNSVGTTTGGDLTLTTTVGPLDHFAISTISSPQTAGTAFTITTITAEDINNATVTSFTGTVTYGGTAGVTGTSGSFTAGVLNNASVTPTLAGTSETVTVTGNGKTGTSGTFTVNPGALNHFAISAISSPQTAGTAFTVTTITAQDVDNNTVTSFTSTVTYGGTAGVTGTSAAFTAGVLNNASVTPTVAGTSETFTVTGSGKTGTSGAFTVNPGALDHFAISAISSPQTAGTPFTIATIKAQDIDNNTVTSFTTTVTYGGTAGVTGTSGAFTAGVLSSASVTPTVAGAGETFTVTGSGKTGTSTFTVNPGALDHFTISAIASPQTAGTPLTITTITAQDVNNNTATNFTSTVTYGGTAGVTGTSGAFTLGVLNNANVTPTIAGPSQTVTVTGSGKTGTSAAFTVNPGALDHFAISAISTQTAGTAFTITAITAQDVNNNTATNFTGTVTYGGTAGVTGTSAAFTLGVLTNVSVTPIMAGASETFTVTGSSKTGSATFTVNPGALTHFVLSGVPYEATAGSPFTVTITAEDVDNNTVTGFNGTVTYGGTAGVAGTSGAFTAGVLNNASVTPVAAGSETLTVNDGSGHTGSASFWVVVSQNLFTTVYADYSIVEFSTSYLDDQEAYYFSSGLSYPRGLAFDYAGNLYEADSSSGRILKFTPGGGQSTFASGLNNPWGLAFDSVGNLYEADYGSGHVYEFTPAGVKSTFASGLANPTGLAFNSAGALFVADLGYQEIFKYTISGGVTNQSTFVSRSEGPYQEGFTAYQLAFNSAGVLFEADYGWSYVYGFATNGALISSLPIDGGNGNGYPDGLAFSSTGALFVSDGYREDVYCFTTNGIQSDFGYVDYGPSWLAFQPPLFTGLTASQSITYGTNAITLAGKLSYNSGQFYPTNGETITVTINGNAQTTTINDATGDFSFSYNPATLPASPIPYPIIYSYAGDSLLIAGNNPSTTLTVNPIAAAITTLPTASAIIYGQALSNSVLSGGVATTPGTFAFTTPSSIPAAGTALQSVTFTPTSGNYATVTTNVSVTVDPYGPVDHFAISPIPSPQTSGMPFTITITAQDAYNNTVASFNGSVSFGGTAGPVVTSEPFVSGVLTISVFPGAVGNNLTVTVNDGAGHSGSANIGTVSLGQNLFESDEFSSNIYEFTTNGVPGPFATALNDPGPLAFNSAGVLFEADLNDGSIYEFATNGVKTTFATSLHPFVGLAFNSAGVLFAVDGYDYQIYEFATNGTSNIFTQGGYYPSGLAFNSAGLLFESDLYTGNVYEFTTNGVKSTYASGLGYPNGLAFDNAGDLFVSDTYSGQIHEITTNGVKSVFASGLSGPAGLAFNSAGILFEDDKYSGNIYEFTTNGAQTTFTSGLEYPAGLAFQPPVFSGLTASQTISYGTSAITLSGNLSYASGQLYPARGKTITVTIGGNSQTTTINDATGDFSVTYNPATIPASATPYPIIYSYGGDPSLLAAMNGATTLTVNQITTTVTAPIAAAITYGQTLSAAVLSGGVASTPGTFAFTTPSAKPVVGTSLQSVTFTPADPIDYTTVITNVSVTVNQATPDITTPPTAAAIAYSQPLSASTLSGAVVVNPYSGATVSGTFAFTTPSLTPGAGTALQSVTFTPADTADYNPVSISVSVTVSAFGPLNHFALSSIPAVQTSGAPLTITVIAQDAYNNTVTNFAGSVTFGGTAGAAGTSGLFLAGVLSNAIVMPVVVGTNLTITVSDGAGHSGSAALSAVNLAQNLFESDQSSDSINEFTTNGVPRAFATGLDYPSGLAFNSADVLFESDFYSGNIYEFTTNGAKSTFASGLSLPSGLAFNNAGVLFEGNVGSAQINAIATNGARSTFASGVSYPYGLAVNSAGVLFEADLYSGNIYEFTTNGTESVFASGLSYPASLAFNRAGVLFVGTYGSGQIFAFATNGTRTTFASGLSGPYGLAFNSAGVLFESDAYSGQIYEFTTNGVKSTFATGLDGPTILAFQPPIFSNLTASQSIAYGTNSITLAGTLSYASATGPIYPAQGESITVTIGGNAQTTTISDVTGDFSFTYNPGTLNVGATPYPIIYSYAGDPLIMAANHAMTTLTVNPYPTTITALPTASSLIYGQTLNASTLSGGSASVPGTFAFTTPSAIPGAGTSSQSVTFTPTSGNYTTVTATVSVTVSQAAPEIASAPSASITFGQALGAATIGGGNVVNPYSGTGVAGTFAFTSPSTTPGTGTAAQGALFTPTDTVDYTSTPTSVNVTVNQATPSITNPPTASAINYTQTLSNSTLSGGIAANPYTQVSVPGTFAFTSPSLKPSVGIHGENVTFTPADTTDYNSTSVTVNVTINPIPVTITTLPTASALTYGQSLGASTLSGGSASASGSFAFTTPSITPPIGTAWQSITFTPHSANYESVTTMISVTVTPAPVTITANPQVTPFGTAIPLVGSLNFTASGLQNGDTIGSVTLTVSGPDAGASNEPVGSYTLTPSAATGGTFNPANYIITYQPGTLIVNPSSLDPMLVVGNPNFATPNQGGGGFSYYTPPNTATIGGLEWTFNSAGIAANGSPWYAAPAPPPANQAAFIQFTGGYISQSVFFPSNGTYQLSWSAIGRSGTYGPKELELLIDGTVIGSPFTPSQSAWTPYTSSPVPLTAGSHTLEFLATATGGANDLSSCITLVAVQSTSTNSNPITTPALDVLHDFPAPIIDGAYPLAGLVLSGSTLYGTTSQGGRSGDGVVFAVNTNGTGRTNIYTFTNGVDGYGPSAGLVLSGNTLYGTTEYGGSGAGTVFAVNIDGTGFTNLYSFTNGNDGASPVAELTLSGNTLYGTAEFGGSGGYGTAFAINTDGTGFTNLYSFTGGNDGAYPLAGLVLSGSILYGTTLYGGNSGAGVVFAVNANGSAFTNVHSFTGGSDGGYPSAGFVLSGNTLYGTAQGGGSFGQGAVFALNTDGSGFTNVYSFTGAADGANPAAGLILSGNTLYGTAEYGGGSGVGVVFAVNTNGMSFTNLYTFTAGNDGGYPVSSLVLSDNVLYGTAPYFGASGNGSVFAVSTDGTTFTVPFSFPPAIYSGDGDQPVAGLILSGDTLYGTTRNGGATGNGAVYSINTDGTGIATLYSFTNGTDGATPMAGLILSGNTLYGTASSGGGSGAGTVFAVNTDGTGFTNLYSFTNGNDGANPITGLFLSGNTLYGTAQYAGSSGYGTVFALNTDGTGFTTLYSFTNGNDGAFPSAGVILSGSTLFGTARAGGTATGGTVFSLNTNGTAFTTLYSFTGGSDGSVPLAGLVLSGDTLYGTAQGGGYLGDGTVFSVNTNTMAFTTLYSFAGSGDGGNPAGGLALSGNVLYGTAQNGGQFGYGTVFAVNTVDTSFATMAGFTGGNDGANPAAGLILSGKTLYGTASQGANIGNGAVVALTLPGSAPSVVWTNPAPLAYGSALTSTQLNAQAAVPGTFAYTPPVGTVLPAGANQTLSVIFTPTDFLDYLPATQTVLININSTQVVPLSVTNFTFTAPGQLSLQFTGDPSVNYTILTTTNLNLPLGDWTSLGAPTVLSNNLYQFTDPHATNAQQYYMLKY